ncbi:leucine-rich repeat domain-containing protein [Aquimarina algicola]|uniref:Leucine-rich repeat domain-containing protein n=1 Tax=Aquimarina algicola TaxID=2589995 RepID=A0A504JEZ7_9FLAO|nr:leucine-rich repeat domain-containing protein [Aquimarina algicola]TPN86308.1 leucine-rich repeat domain-containing protein [Aquimarina algicola]
MSLTEKQIQYGFNYFFPDESNKIKSVVELKEFDGERKLSINCTQLDYWIEKNGKKPEEKQRILTEWCNFLRENPNTFEELYFGTRMPQELFDAVCHQKELKRLEIKWGSYEDLASIRKLTEIEFLDIGSGSAVQSIEPLTALKKLKGLQVENFQKIQDYDAFSKLTSLESLFIDGDRTSPRNIRIESIDFLRKMPQLKCYRMLATILVNKDYSPILELKNLEYLAIRGRREVKKMYDDFAKLPKLKWGWGWKEKEMN